MKYAFALIKSGIIGGGPNVPQLVVQAVSQLDKHNGRLITVFPLIEKGETTGALLIAEVTDPPAPAQAADPGGL